MPAPNKYLTIPAAAAELGISASMAKRAASHGRKGCVDWLRNRKGLHRQRVTTLAWVEEWLRAKEWVKG